MTSSQRPATRSSSAYRRATAPRSEVGGHPCQGIYWTPKGQRPRVALIATHYNVDFAEHYLAPYIASRGYGFLGWNTRYRGAEDLFTLEHALIDIACGHEMAARAGRRAGRDPRQFRRRLADGRLSGGSHDADACTRR